MDAGRIIGEAFAAIEREEREDAMRDQYRRAMRVLRTIPSGTHADDLTAEQREAWRLHDDAIKYLTQREETTMPGIITLRDEMPNGYSVADWLGTAMTAARASATILESTRARALHGHESDLRHAADYAAQALAEIVAVMDHYGMAHGYGENVTFQ